MDNKIKSILDEFDMFVPDRQKHKVIESRAQNAIISAINIIKLIESSFDSEDSDDLIKKFFLSIKTGDANKFCKKIRILSENADETRRIKTK